MTNLAALKAKLNYPLSDNSYILALSDRDLVYTSEYSSSDKEALELAYADLIYTLCSHPNISEGNYSVRISNVKQMKDIADGIYRKYDIGLPTKKTAKFVQKW